MILWWSAKSRRTCLTLRHLFKVTDVASQGIYIYGGLILFPGLIAILCKLIVPKQIPDDSSGLEVKHAFAVWAVWQYLLAN